MTDIDKTIEVERERITVTTNLNVPSNYQALPIFAGQGWIAADAVKQKEMSKQYKITDEETGAAMLFTPSWERTDTLHDGHPEHIKNTGETGPSGDGKTFHVGDFLVDFRHNSARWTGMNWDKWDPQIRVRIHPNITNPDPEIVVQSPE